MLTNEQRDALVQEVGRLLEAGGAAVAERLQCFGYYGFGTGYVLAAKPNPMQHANGQVVLRPVWACQDCPVAPECWQAHRQRVRKLFPDITAEVDRWQERGAAYMARAARELDGCEPYLAVMSGNVQDGAHVLTTGTPQDRGPGTLAWPLTPVPPVES